jgi:tocopherol O-methyltransferase
MAPAGWSRANVRHAASVLRHGSNPAAIVYDSLGQDFFVALAPGWLNLGLWDGDGSDPAEAPVAVRRLVETIARELPSGGDVLDVGNGLAEQDPVIAGVASTRSLTAVNITRSQLVAGAARLAEAGAWAVHADATRLPLRGESFHGVISVEAAFHFSSRAAFFAEAYRVLSPGGTVAVSTWCRRDGECSAEDERLLNEIYQRQAIPSLQPLREYEAAGRAAGFADVRTADWTEHVRRTWDTDYTGVERLDRDSSFVRDLARTKGVEVLRFFYAIPLMKKAYDTGIMRYAAIRGTRPAI